MRKLFGTRSRDTSDLLIFERTFGISFQNALLNRSTQLRGIHKFREIKSASLERGKSSLLAAEAATQRVVPGPRARRVLTTGAVASAGAGESLSTQILSCPSCTALCALHCTDFMTFLFVATLSLRDANTLLMPFVMCSVSSSGASSIRFSALEAKYHTPEYRSCNSELPFFLKQR